MQEPPLVHSHAVMPTTDFRNLMKPTGLMQLDEANRLDAT